MLPVANRPWIDYWLEWCVDLGIHDVRIVLGEGAKEIEDHVGDGAAWGLAVTYGFLREDRDPDDILRRGAAHLEQGLLYVRAPVFPRRRVPGPPPAPARPMLHRDAGGVACWLAPDAAAARALLAGEEAAAGSFDELGMEPLRLDSVPAWFDLTMRLAGGEAANYVSPGYLTKDGANVGYNVVLPPSSVVTPPLIIGNDCRFDVMTEIGPAAVIGNHVIVDRQTTLRNCIVLDHTYVGRNLEIDGKVLAGRRLVDGSDGTAIVIEDPWLLSRAGQTGGVCDAARAAAGFLAAAVLAAIGLVPFLLLAVLLRATGGGRCRRVPVLMRNDRVHPLTVFDDGAGTPNGVTRLFRALALDLYPRLFCVLAGRLRLCGHEPLRMPEEGDIADDLPAYFPAAFSYETAEGRPEDPNVRRAHALYYCSVRSFVEDLRILGRAFAARPAAALSAASND